MVPVKKCIFCIHIGIHVVGFEFQKYYDECVSWGLESQGVASNSNQGLELRFHNGSMVRILVGV